mmetsp:Transcript_10710/g.38005  ORF Transcript_10710/g.38005 Transcript_10710/m.38005 type:complete len:273 (-) Transcript_10710:1501-2319(-)
MELHGKVELRDGLDRFLHDMARGGVPEHRTHLLGGHVPQPVHSDVLLLQLVQDFRLEQPGELPQGVLIGPASVLKGLAETQHQVGHRTPPALEAQLEEGAADSRSVVRHVGGVHGQRKAAKPCPRHVALEEDVHFPVRIFRASPDLHGAAVERQVVELVHLVLPNVDILKLSALGNHLNDVRVGHVGVELLVVQCHARVLKVVQRGDPAELCDVEIAALLVKDSHLALVQSPRGIGHNLPSRQAQRRVIVHCIPRDPVSKRIFPHPRVQIGV